MKTHPDAADRTLAAGDLVMGTYGGYSGLSPMLVTGFTPKAIRCEPLKSLYGASGRGGVAVAGVRLIRFPSQVVLVKTGDGTPLESRTVRKEENASEVGPDGVPAS